MVYGGWFTRLTCSACEDTFEVEEDCQSGEVQDCPSCGEEGEVLRGGV